MELYHVQVAVRGPTGWLTDHSKTRAFDSLAEARLFSAQAILTPCHRATILEVVDEHVSPGTSGIAERRRHSRSKDRRPYAKHR